MNIITDNPAFSSPKSKIGIFEVIGHISDAFHFEPYATHQLCGADWFVIVLFYVTIAFCLVYWISNQLCNSERIKNSILLLSGVAALYVGNILKQREIFLDGYLSPAITCYAIYVIGYFLKKAGTIEAWIEKYSFVVIILGAVALSFLNRTGSVSLGSNYFTTVPHVLLSSVVGWYWLMAIAKSISKKNGKMIRVISYALSYIGTRSIWILFLHFLSFKPVNALLVLLYNEPAYMIASFPTYNAGGCWWIIFSICGICLPLLAQRAVAVLAGKVCKKVSEIEKVKL